MEKNLQDLLKLLPDAEVTGAAGKTITDITADSRVVVPGSLFICLKGATVDGHKFLQQAHEKGAVAAIVEDAKANPTMGALTSGQFMSTSNNNFVLFIDKINGNQISDVYLFQMKAKGQTKPSVVTAEKGELKALPNGDQVLNLQNTLRVEGTSVLPDFRITHFDDYQAYLGHQETNSESDEAAELSFEQLLKDKSAAAKAELHWRITLILAVPLMALIAVPMSKVNPRQGRFAKILPALLLYLIYFLLQSSFKSAGGAGKLDAGLLMPLVNIAFLILGIVLNSWDSTAMHKFRRVFRKG